MINYKFLFVSIFVLLLNNCTSTTTSNIENQIVKKKYSNKGFTLVFNENLLKDKIVSKKIDNRSLTIYHKTLKKNSNVKIINLKNDKTLIAKVKSNKVNFPAFFNSVISKRISEDLELDVNDPYIELILIVDNSSFVAKKTKTFEEEKSVAEKAPIDGITINDLNKKNNKKKESKNEKFTYFIKVADFYYISSAKNMLKKIKKETTIKKKKILTLSKTKFRVVLGPFNDIVSLKDSYNEMIRIGFENIEIVKDV
tara:strand:- start:833 stop:1594 length:762 start_codon:yes stop_codon:yes gene_type:complete